MIIKQFFKFSSYDAFEDHGIEAFLSSGIGAFMSSLKCLSVCGKNVKICGKCCFVSFFANTWLQNELSQPSSVYNGADKVIIWNNHPSTHHPPTHTQQTLNRIVESELSHFQKTKVGSLYDWTPKQLSNLVPTPKIAHWGPKSQK